MIDNVLVDITTGLVSGTAAGGDEIYVELRRATIGHVHALRVKQLYVPSSNADALQRIFAALERRVDKAGAMLVVGPLRASDPGGAEIRQMCRERGYEQQELFFLRARKTEFTGFP